MTALPAGCTGIAVLYGAKSTEDKHDSVGTQLSEARELAEDNGWLVLGSESDEGFSAYSGNRGPALERVVALAAQGAAEYGMTCQLVGQAHDRFARGAGDEPGAPQSLGELWHRCRRLDVHLRTVEDDEELRDEASVAAVGRRAHIDSRRKAKSVTKGMKRRRTKGLHTGGPKKFGYRYQRNPDGSTVAGACMLRDEPQATIWREQVFQAAMDGVSGKQIANRLNDAGVPTTQGGRWHPSSVRKMLLDPFYAGKLKQPHGELVDGEHDGLVSWDEWTALQKLRAAQPHQRGGGRRTGSPALFTNQHLRCGACGGAMGYRRKPNRSGGYWERYVCVERERDRRLCEQGPVHVHAVEEAARRALAADTSVTETAHDLGVRHRAELELVEAQRQDALRLVLQSEERERRAENDYLDGKLPVALYERATERVLSERAAAQAQLAQVERHLEELSTNTEHVSERQVIMEAMEELRSALTNGPVERARHLLRRAYPQVTLRGAQQRLWLELEPSPLPQVGEHYSDELGPLYAGEPVQPTGSTATGHHALPWCPLVAELVPA
jgi:site-specific DNA recombinase